MVFWLHNSPKTSHHYLQKVYTSNDSLVSCTDTIHITIPTPLLNKSSFFEQGVVMTNPVHDQLILRPEGTWENKKAFVRIHDLLGRELFSSEIVLNINHKISVSSWPVGQYIISIQCNDQYDVKKFLKL